MVCLSIRDVETFEHLELNSDAQSWVRSVNHCFSEDTIVENTFQPGLYITLLGQCQYRPLCGPLEREHEPLKNFNYHYAITLADKTCPSRILFPAGANWQSLSIMLPLSQLVEFGISSLSDIEEHIRPVAKISELGAISGDLFQCCEAVWSCGFKGLERQLYIKAKAFEILSLILHKRRENSQNKMSSRLSQLSQALEHVEKNLDHDWNLPSLARLAASNQTYIKQDLKDLLGMSFRKWLNKKRVTVALELLSTDRTINEIANEIGFKGQAYFATMFKNEVGVTPSEYRQSLLLRHSA